MADTAISALTAATVFNNTDEIGVNQGGVSKKVSGLLLQNWQGGILRNQSTAAQLPPAASTTYLTGSNISVPAALLRIGTLFRWTLFYTKDAFGAVARSHLIKIGTLGTTGDATIITLTQLAGTAIADIGYSIITATVRGPLSASCIMTASEFFAHNNSGTTGLSATNEVGVNNIISGTWNATTANLIVGLAVTTGTAENLTYQQIITEAYNL